MVQIMQFLHMQGDPFHFLSNVLNFEIFSIVLIPLIIISLFAHSETMIVSIEHSKTHSKYKYNKYIQQYITYLHYIIHYINNTLHYLAISTLGRLILLTYIHII